MTYRPPLEGDWKNLSYVIVFVLGCILFILVLSIFLQLKNDEDVKHTEAHGIIIMKKSIGKGNFTFLLKESNITRKFVMAGNRHFFNQVLVGDSLSKRPESYFFDVFRKTDSAYKLICTIGYE